MPHLHSPRLKDDEFEERLVWNRQMNYYPLFVAHDIKEKGKVVAVAVDWYFGCKRQAMLFKLRWL